jgi:hypothetical protein
VVREAVAVVVAMARSPVQRNNRASKMITGIGTPSSQSKIPRPICIS